MCCESILLSGRTKVHSDTSSCCWVICPFLTVSLFDICAVTAGGCSVLWGLRYCLCLFTPPFCSSPSQAFHKPSASSPSGGRSSRPN